MRETESQRRIETRPYCISYVGTGNKAWERERERHETDLRKKEGEKRNDGFVSSTHSIFPLLPSSDPSRHISAPASDRERGLYEKKQQGREIRKKGLRIQVRSEKKRTQLRPWIEVDCSVIGSLIWFRVSSVIKESVAMYSLSYQPLKAFPHGILRCCAQRDD